MDRSIHLRGRTITLAILLLLAAPAGHVVAETLITHPYAGITHIVRTETAPRPLKIHVIDVDLAAPDIRLRLTPPGGARETTKQTTLQFLAEQKAQVAVNVHFFEPWPAPKGDSGEADLVGIAASDGCVYSGFESHPPKPIAIRPDAPGLNIDANNRATIVHRKTGDPSGRGVAENVTLYNTLSGNEQIVSGGKATVANTDWNNRPNPRTAVGVTAGNHLILLTVDGRQNGVSEGLKSGELAAMLVKDYGVVDAINLDGGGSTTLAMDDPSPHVVNVPVGLNDVPGSERPVGSNLAIFAARQRPSATTAPARP